MGQGKNHQHGDEALPTEEGNRDVAKVPVRSPHLGHPDYEAAHEEFFEHGLKGHRFTLYDEVIRIPMIFWYPKKIAPGTRIQDPTSIVDVFPTLLELAGLPASSQPMGRSLAGHLGPDATDGDPSPIPTRLAISELNTLGRNIATFRGINKKLRLDNETGRAMTFDLRIDPREKLGTPVRKTAAQWERSLIQQTAALRTVLTERSEAFAVDETSPQLSSALMEQLQVLGYIDEPLPTDGETDSPRGSVNPGEGVTGDVD